MIVVREESDLNMQTMNSLYHHDQPNEHNKKKCMFIFIYIASKANKCKQTLQTLIFAEAHSCLKRIFCLFYQIIPK